MIRNVIIEAESVQRQNKKRERELYEKETEHIIHSCWQQKE